jgi:hypothetical protein
LWHYRDTTSTFSNFAGADTGCIYSNKNNGDGMSYDKEADLLKMYKYKCGFEYENGYICPIKFMDKPELILHLLYQHGIKVKDVSLPKSDLAPAIRSINIVRKSG